MWKQADQVQVGDRIQVWRGVEPEWETITQVHADPQLIRFVTVGARGSFELTLQRTAQVNVGASDV